MHIVAADFRIRITVPVKQRERRRGISNRLLDDVSRKQNPFAALVSFQAAILKSPLHLGAANLHADFGH
jgi:hypothetical protein